MTDKLPQTQTLAENLNPDSEDASHTAETDSSDSDSGTGAEPDTHTPTGESSSSESSDITIPWSKGADLTAGDHTSNSSTGSQTQSNPERRRPLPVPHKDTQGPHDPRRTQSETGHTDSDGDPTVALSWRGIPDIVLPRCPGCGEVGTMCQYSLAERDGFLNAHCDNCSGCFLVDPNPEK